MAVIPNTTTHQTCTAAQRVRHQRGGTIGVRSLHGPLGYGASRSGRQRAGPREQGSHTGSAADVPNRATSNRTTNTRRGAMQDAPWFSCSPKARQRAQRSRSASGKTNTASQPDNLHRGGREGLSQQSLHVTAGICGPGQYELVDSCLNGGVYAGDIFGQDLDERSIPAGDRQTSCIATAAAVAPGAGLSTTAFPAASACSSCTPGRNNG